MGDQLSVNVRLVRADNQWGMNKTPLIIVSLYREDSPFKKYEGKEFYITLKTNIILRFFI
ncbi:hypothetical protein BJR07_20405 [Bacillus cereus]|uniref:Uncharacterized protein n=1 Tax=Bacillus cereus TaxID=1396 RepID=A0A1Q4L8U9_BACCE|nr:hypothetical protein BJR06_24595 [Bacillus cereus]OKA35354.1 hypothetical protein BJR07_20405 [Bacillus cereus]